jgi:hypothetical protein
MKNLRAGSHSKRSFPRWQVGAVPTCKCGGKMVAVLLAVPRFVSVANDLHGASHLTRQAWKCERPGCHFYIAGEMQSELSEAFREKELRKAGRYVDGDA